MPEIVLGKRTIDSRSFPYLIAEIGVNHEGSLEQAKRLIELAKEGGADAAKFQTYKAETLAAQESPAYWDLTKEKTQSQFALFKKYDRFGPKEYRALAEHCDRVGITFASTPFDLDAVDFLSPLVPFFKIASADITNLPLLRRIASKQKPVLLSTGASRLAEIRRAVSILQPSCPLALLHCVLNYPTQTENAHLNAISDLVAEFPELVIGYSDHTLPDPTMMTLGAAYLKGAVILEKHFTHDKNLPGNDHYHAMDVRDLKALIQTIRTLRLLEGQPYHTPGSSEEISRKNARRSLVTARPIKAGTPFTPDALIAKRPATGISPIDINEVMGSHARYDLDEDHILQWSDLKPHEKTKRVVAIVQARMGSKRYPGKMLECLAGVPLIEWVLLRLRRSRHLAQVILATSDEPANEKLIATAHRLGMEAIRGDEQDVLSRFVQAAKASSADVIVRVCADNPFIDPREVDRLIEFYFHSRPDYAFNHRCGLSNGYADGFGAEIFSREILEELDLCAKEPPHREHVTSYLWEHPHAFDIRTFPAPKELFYETLRFDVDTPKDLEALRPLGEKYGIEGKAAQFVKGKLAL